MQDERGPTCLLLGSTEQVANRNGADESAPSTRAGGAFSGSWVALAP